MSVLHRLDSSTSLESDCDNGPTLQGSALPLLGALEHPPHPVSTQDTSDFRPLGVLLQASTGSGLLRGLVFNVVVVGQS